MLSRRNKLASMGASLLLLEHLRQSSMEYTEDIDFNVMCCTVLHCYVTLCYAVTQEQAGKHGGEPATAGAP
jgi:hypothetical protein